MTAPASRFSEYLDEWRVHLDSLTAPAFWVYTIATKHKDGRPYDVLHIHGALGGIFSYDDMRELLSHWSGNKPWLRKIRGYKNAWGWLHYLYSQEKVTHADPFAHARDIFSHCHHLLLPPFESPTLETLSHDYRTSVKRKAGQKAGAGKGKKWLTWRARKAAAARWGEDL